MEVFLMHPTEDSPEVVLNKESGVLKIVGNSFSEDPFTIYGRIFAWLDEYKLSPNKNTIFDFSLNYINTASSKQIVEILKKLEEIDEKSDVLIRWAYVEGDEDTLSEGEELSKMFNLNFDFIEI